jgi:hypothetical protein
MYLYFVHNKDYSFQSNSTFRVGGADSQGADFRLAAVKKHEAKGL